MDRHAALHRRGYCTCDGHKQAKGRGKRNDPFVANAQIYAGEIVAAKTRLAGIASAQAATEKGDATALDTALPKLPAFDQERADLVGRRGDLIAHYDARVAAALLADPEYQPPADGLIPRQEAFAD